MLKKIVFLSLISGTIIIGTIIVVGLLSNQNNSLTNNSPSQSASTAPPSSQNKLQVYPLSEVAKHNSESDCWLIINNQVYNVTNYINQHPGGAMRITQFCGQEATQAFQTKGGEGQHSNNASKILTQYLIGSIQ